MTFELAVSPVMRIVDLQRLISVGQYSFKALQNSIKVLDSFERHSFAKSLWEWQNTALCCDCCEAVLMAYWMALACNCRTRLALRLVCSGCLMLERSSMMRKGRCNSELLLFSLHHPLLYMFQNLRSALAALSITVMPNVTALLAFAPLQLWSGVLAQQVSTLAYQSELAVVRHGTQLLQTVRQALATQHPPDLMEAHCCAAPLRLYGCAKSHVHRDVS